MKKDQTIDPIQALLLFGLFVFLVGPLLVFLLPSTEPAAIDRRERLDAYFTSGISPLGGYCQVIANDEPMFLFFWEEGWPRARWTNRSDEGTYTLYEGDRTFTMVLREDPETEFILLFVQDVQLDAPLGTVYTISREGDLFLQDKRITEIRTGGEYWDMWEVVFNRRRGEFQPTDEQTND